MLLALIAGVISIVGYAATRFNDVEIKLHDIELKLIDMEYRTADRWRATDMKVWSFELERSNKDKDLVVPDPWAILNREQ